MPNLTSAADDSVTRAENGPHRYWTIFDLSLEGARYQELQSLVETEPFRKEEAERVAAELLGLANGYGYGQTDSLIFDIGDLDDPDLDDEKLSRKEAVLDRFEEDNYYELTNKSYDLLMAACATSEAKNFIDSGIMDISGITPRCALFMAVIEAYNAGCRERIESEIATAAKPKG